jgi:hypothetical protein
MRAKMWQSRKRQGGRQGEREGGRQGGREAGRQGGRNLKQIKGHKE